MADVFIYACDAAGYAAQVRMANEAEWRAMQGERPIWETPWEQCQRELAAAGYVKTLTPDGCEVYVKDNKPAAEQHLLDIANAAIEHRLSMTAYGDAREAYFQAKESGNDELADDLSATHDALEKAMCEKADAFFVAVDAWIEAHPELMR